MTQSTDLAALVAQAQARYEALSPVDRAIADLKQRASWVTGELRMNDDAAPNGVTAEQAEARLRQVAPEYVVLAAYEALRREMVAIEQFALARSGDGSVTRVEREQWYRMVAIARRAMGAP